MLTYQSEQKIFVWQGSFEDRERPRAAGFEWSPAGKCWYTASPYIAYLLKDEADPGAIDRLSRVAANVTASQDTDPVLEMQAPRGLKYFPFQAAGIEHMVDRLRAGNRAVLCADEQGLGKTMSAIGVANEMGYKKLLVICPASLRLNWKREIELWHVHNLGVDPVLNGKERPCYAGSVVTSYNLAGGLEDYRPDFIIVDETHYIKNAGTQRTKLVLGDGKGWRGLVDKAPTIFLTGTPIPNGKPVELWPLLFRCSPKTINYMKYWPFARRFCNMIDDGIGGYIILGAKRKEELYTRLRGSGFMTRRLKKNVLKDLPPKRYKMVVFPANGETRRVLKKEENFNAQEIIKHGVPVGTALPEIRREMGVAKIPQSLEYIQDLLEGGADKVVVFAHHLEPVGLLEAGLSVYNPVVITGSTNPRKKQANVDKFQEDPTVRVFIGNEAAEEGITLTAAHDVVLVEPEWVPGKNEQRVDRLHRIGQNESVMVHILVVERSLDAKILGSAAHKQTDIKSILDN